MHITPQAEVRLQENNSCLIKDFSLTEKHNEGG